MSKPGLFTVWVLRGSSWSVLSSVVATRLYRVQENALKAAQEHSRMPGVDQTKVLAGRLPNSPLIGSFIRGERTDGKSDD